ncbi:alpha/beta hydrolase [Flagellimonas sp. S3867]|uniref:alpha/beta hydrolase n=1 Tax=Flagellimonas sp. S3867 TaxID=2768063 RepID=UPI001687B9BC|nr:alpha/beta hydrolase [Flagellimonas sp. S3867]
MKKYAISVFIMLIGVTNSFGQDDLMPLWPNGIPNQRESNEKESHNNDDILWIENVQEPSLQIFLPSKRNATGKAIIICPGGGYQGLAYDWEGTDVAKWLNSIGIAAFVLKYRLPGSKSLIEKSKAPLQDAQRAVRLVRYHAEKWNIAKEQIGIMGFSAGGHLASTLGTHYNDEVTDKSDDLDQISARPNFMILIYPVITMNPAHTHMGSRVNLIGENPQQKLINQYSNELHIDKNTPPTFLVHSTDDEAVPVENSLLFYQSLKENSVYAEMHIYPEGGHGYSLAIGQGYLQSWTDRLTDWLGNFD